MSFNLFADANIQPPNTYLSNSIGSNTVIVQVTCLFGCSSTWKRSGFISQILQIPDLGEVKGEFRKTLLGMQLIKFTDLGVPYQLMFELNDWIPSANVKIWIYEG